MSRPSPWVPSGSVTRVMSPSGQNRNRSTPKVVFQGHVRLSDDFMVLLGVGPPALLQVTGIRLMWCMGRLLSLVVLAFCSGEHECKSGRSFSSVYPAVHGSDLDDDVVLPNGDPHVIFE